MSNYYSFPTIHGIITSLQIQRIIHKVRSVFRLRKWHWVSQYLKYLWHTLEPNGMCLIVMTWLDSSRSVFCRLTSNLSTIHGCPFSFQRSNSRFSHTKQSWNCLIPEYSVTSTLCSPRLKVICYCVTLTHYLICLCHSCPSEKLHLHSLSHQRLSELLTKTHFNGLVHISVTSVIIKVPAPPSHHAITKPLFCICSDMILSNML